MSKTPKFDALADRDKAFVLEYIRCNFDPTATVVSLGLDAEHTNPGSAWMTGRLYLGHFGVREAIDEMFIESHMTALELLTRHSEIASADMRDLIDEETGCLDLKKAMRLGKTRLIKAITTRKWWDKGKGGEMTETRCELHNAQQAQLALMKHRGLFVEAIKVKDLPTDPDELAALLAKQIERTTGQKVSSAAPKKEGN